MNYVLREMTVEDENNVLEKCGEREKNRLIRLRLFEGPSPYTWAVDEAACSYLLRVFRKGDPREDIREDYHFFFNGHNHYIITNGKWPLCIKYMRSEVLESQIKDFEDSLYSAFEVHGLLGELGKENFVSDISIVGE